MTGEKDSRAAALSDELGRYYRYMVDLYGGNEVRAVRHFRRAIESVIQVIEHNARKRTSGVK